MSTKETKALQKEVREALKEENYKDAIKKCEVRFGSLKLKSH